MVPFQIYQVLTDQRAHELTAAARRHEWKAEAQLTRTDRTGPSSRLKDVGTRLVALAHDPDGTQAGSTTTATASAGPVGCAT